MRLRDDTRFTGCPYGRVALPAAVSDDGAVTPESLFEGVMVQQVVLKRDQQLTEWVP